MPSLIFDPPVTIEECTAAGRQFGETWANRPRAEFEEALIQRLAAIDELAPLSSDAEEAMAAFDQAAWHTWEALQPDEAASSGQQRPRRRRIAWK
jgi:hypothetical protein